MHSTTINCRSRISEDDWNELADEFPKQTGNPSVPLYALPLKLIDAIDEESGLFTEDDLRFERALAHYAPGFYMRRRLYCPLLLSSYAPADGTQRAELAMIPQQVNERENREALVQRLRQARWTYQRIDQYLERMDKSTARMEVVSAAYVSWLVANPEFRRRLGRLEHTWGPTIANIGKWRAPWVEGLPYFGYFPIVPPALSSPGPLCPPENLRKCWEDFQSFYFDWSLETLSTWELPVPMRPSGIVPRGTTANASQTLALDAFCLGLCSVPEVSTFTISLPNNCWWRRITCAIG